jgi:hypothetical protein
MKCSQGEWKTDVEITNEVTVYAVPEKGNCMTIADIRPKPEKGQRAANAHLISAAPDMYEALRTIISYDLKLPTAVMKKAHDALTKANSNLPSLW